MPIETSVRTRRPAAAVMALQTAYGTPVDDFRIISGGVRLWTRKASLSASKVKNQPRWMDTLYADAASSRVALRDNSDGQVIAVATPESVKMLLKNNWGPLSGSPLSSTLSSTVSKYASLAWVEDTRSGATQRLVRLSDVFVYRLKLALNRADGKLVLTGDYSSRKSENFFLNNLGSVQFTAAPMTPADVRVYNVRNSSFVRDPAGDNVSLDFIELEITLDQQVNAEWTYSDHWDVWKRGKTGVYVRALFRLTNEVWDVIDNSNLTTLERFTVTASTDGSPSSVLTVNLYSLDWTFENIGHDETGGCLVEARARGFSSASTPETGFVKFSIT